LVFVATNYIDSNTSFWQERLGHLLYQASQHHVISPVLSARDLPPLHAHTDPELRTSIRRLVDTVRALEYHEIDDLIGELETVLEENGYVDALRPVDQFMTWRQVRDLLQHGIAIGSHTCSHKSLTRLTNAELQAELTKSREMIREHTGTAVTTLAYPGGHFDSRSITAAASNDYGLGFTTERGFAADTTEPLRIPRLNIHEAVASTTPLFISHLFQVFRKWPRNPA
jgi:peptidoglycan/xylan/chitin deacetylase (PgdA/CDA1 family)